MNNINLDEIIKPFLKKYNISKYGVVDNLEPLNYEKFENWVNLGHDKPLNYLSDERMHLRKSLVNVFSSAKQTIVFAFDYSQSKKALNSTYQKSSWNKLKLAAYTVAYPEDYHFYLKRALNEIGQKLKSNYPELEYKIALDVQPILERDFAYQAGLGWVGKNSMLIDTEFGSYFLIGSIILNDTLFSSSENFQSDHCGSCTSCISACPTDAIDPNTRTLISSKCISTFTIEIFKDVAAPLKMEKASGEFFGCDICQEACPWNQKRLERLPETELSHFLSNFFLFKKYDDLIREIHQMSIRAFKKYFISFPLARSGKMGILKNLLFWKNHKENSSR